MADFDLQWRWLDGLKTTSLHPLPPFPAFYDFSRCTFKRTLPQHGGNLGLEPRRRFDPISFGCTSMKAKCQRPAHCAMPALVKELLIVQIAGALPCGVTQSDRGFGAPNQTHIIVVVLSTLITNTLTCGKACRWHSASH